MKKQIILITALLFFFAGNVFAHAPKKPDISYDKENSQLVIKFEHGVKDAGKHFLDIIWIYIDGEEYQVLEYTEQTSTDVHTLRVDVPVLESGTKIKVTAKCNKMGKKSGKLVIE